MKNYPFQQINEKFNKFFSEIQKEFYDDKVLDLNTNIVSLPDRYIVEIELPGVKKEDIKITLEDDHLTVQGKKQRKSYEDEKLVQVERQQGDFKRTFKLNNDIDPQNIKAKFEEGVLYITLQKLQVEKQKETTIVVE
ncbi:MAG: Hsp20/alpha crystallin family protein [Bacteroidia bacterium]|nr:Hsp20/alpha crystallin family protein [Bacteroidia bacterium]MDW8347573.1 Hsp20/alpha crystallin family protein [Bacteroidia bacterium]